MDKYLYQRGHHVWNEVKLRMLRTLVAELCDQVEIILSEQHGSRDQIRTSGNPPLFE